MVRGWRLCWIQLAVQQLCSNLLETDLHYWCKTRETLSPQISAAGKASKRLAESSDPYVCSFVRVHQIAVK